MAQLFPAALLLPSDAYDTQRHQVMGRRVAGLGFAKGIASSLKPGEQLTVIGSSSHELRHLGATLQPLLQPDSELVLHPRIGAESVRSAGCLHIPDPGIARWTALRHGFCSTSFSLTGVIHTLCSAAVLDVLEELETAPLHPWDALVCTSQAGRQVVEAAMEGRHALLERRFQISLPIPPRPRLPLIPLAIDPRPFQWQEQFSSRSEQRQAARQQLGVPADAFVVVFLGRLSFHSKAHPLPLYRAVARLASKSQRPLVLLECGHLYNAAIGEAFDRLFADIQPLAPTLKLRRLGGLEPASETEKLLALAAADAFCSPADNLQETFGLSVLEAMASELPVVVSDWNGYRDLVVHGETGLLVPTIDALATQEEGADSLEAHYRLGLVNYDTMVGMRSLAVAVDSVALEQALSRLLNQPAWAAAMGVSARRRVEERFSWPVVSRQYRALWEELNALRRATAADTSAETASYNHVPYQRLFGHYASDGLRPGRWWRPEDATPAEFLQSTMQRSFVSRWCGDALERLVVWLQSSMFPADQDGAITDEQFRNGLLDLGICESNVKPLQVCLLKLGILEKLQ